MEPRKLLGQVVRRVAPLLVVLGFPLAPRLTAQAEVWRTVGDARADRFGLSVAIVADVDGDGRRDLLIGAPSDAPSRGNLEAGRLGRAALHSSASGALLREWSGDGRHDAFGTVVAAAGDVDGDGHDDYAITAPKRTTPGSAPGALYLYSGADGTLLHGFVSSSPDVPEFGTDVAGIGDVDGDGCADLVSSRFDVESANELVLVLSGRTGATIRSHVGGNAPLTTGFGIDVDAAGDVDADGVGDYVVAAPFETRHPPDAGVAYVYSGASGTLIWMLQTPVAGDGYGRSVCGAGDVDGDGHADLLVGNPSYPLNAGPQLGLIGLHSGATGNAIMSVTGSASDALGIALSRSGDLDGDGAPDFVATAGMRPAIRLLSGATGATLQSFDPDVAADASVDASADLDGDGRADLLAGFPAADASDQDPFAGRAIALDLTGGTPLFDAHGLSFRSMCGAALTIVADRDGDGHREVALGLPGGDGTNAGIVRVLSGDDGTEVARLSSGSPADRFGAALVEIGDVDGDHLLDLAIGAPGTPGGGAVELRSGADDSLLATIAAPSGAAAFGRELACGRDAAGAPFLAICDPGWTSGAAVLGRVEVHDLTHAGAPVVVTGTAAATEFGAAIGCAGDVDGDGMLDWAVGAPRAGATMPDAGSVTLFSGADGSTIWQNDGVSAGQLLGGSVAGGDDLDGDGIGDVLAGATFAPNARAGRVVGWSGADGSRILTLDGTHKSDRYGSAVSFLGDVNRDGVADFAIGAPGPSKAGEVFVYSGATVGLLVRVDGDEFGEVLADLPCGGAARVDPDGIADLLVGGPDAAVEDSDVGRAQLHRLDDLYLQVDPPEPPAGFPVTVETRGGPAGNVAGIFVLDLDGIPLNFFLGYGTFDAVGIWSITDNVPAFLTGHTLRMVAFAIGFTGGIVGSQDVTVAFR